MLVWIWGQGLGRGLWNQVWVGGWENFGLELLGGTACVRGPRRASV